MVRTARGIHPRRMEEASVAGESPDRSEQQKSSGTARSESDPRLAVFREGSAEGGEGGGTDTATAVFRTGSSVAGESGGESGDAVDGGADTATAVFRAPAPKDAASEGPEGPEGAGSASDSPEEASPAPSEGPAASATDSEGSGPAASGEDSAREESSGEGSEGSGRTGDASSPASRDAASAEAGDARLREAVAAWVAKDDDAGEGTKSEAATEGAEGAEEPVEEPGPKSESRSAATTETEADTDADRTEAEDKNKAEDTKGGAAEAAGGKNDAAATKDGEPTKDAADGADGADGEGRNADKKTADKKTADTGTGGEEKGGEGKTGVDQPTAIFRAPAPAPVDQPTTALKVIPPASKNPDAKPDAKATPNQGADAKPESDAERTSTFVPLRRDDVRPAQEPASKPGGKPASAASASAPAPTPVFAPAERTTQQPMPPKPPLDLLAELTNTPPPPETPVRTAVRRVKIWTPLVLLLLIIFAIVQMVRPLPAPELQMSAKSTYTFEGSKPSLPWPDEGQGYMAATGLGTVGSFGEQKAVPIGSVAKAMTAYIVLKGHPLKKGEEGPSIEVDATAEKEGGYDAVNESTLNTVKKGDKLTLKQALSAIMIPSANNIARLLARWDAGSEEAFVKKMNDTAKSLGMKNTTYTDPSGLNATTVSSAEDQVKLGEKLVEIPALMAITVLPSWTDPSGHEWRNWNNLVPFNGSLGIKTGSTTKAGGNLLFAAHKMVGKTDQLIVGAVLGQHKNPIIDTANAVSKDVMIATQDLLKDAKVMKKGDVVGSVSDGLGGSTPVIVTKDVTVVGWSGLTVKIELTDDGKTIPHSAKAGTPVGTLTVGEGASQVRVPVALGSELTEPTFGDKLTRIG
ncbi:D-alanyl-D-alanine carboxypeptidase [Streptomyces sp. NPDC056061]|uniref:D-alanyl-D-alanine carboxypeptidase n=1 Tax=Streptomyces sp. NPDC056061 TaxID=3345700 RepID=UPI0035E0B62F